MRWYLSTLLVFVASPVFAQAQENEAEKLFRAMEDKVRKADTIAFACEFAGSVLGKDQEIKLSISAQIATGNKAKYVSEGRIGAGSHKSILVSNGNQMISQTEPDSPATPTPTDPDLNARIVNAMARGGFMLARLKRASPRDKVGARDIERFLPIQDFKMGLIERVGQVECQVVKHTALLDELEGEKALVRVWISTRTLLPLKREVELPQRDSAKYTETYTEFVLNPKLDPKLFELPK